MLGVTFIVGNKQIHSCKDWNLAFGSYTISSPESKTYTVDIPGMDGVLDLSESLTGDIQYKNRKITLNFSIISSLFKQPVDFSKIYNCLHGRTVKLIFDNDPSFYWIGRLSVSTYQEAYLLGSISIECDIEPYKYERYSSIEPWLWDTFNFEQDIIREYKDLQISGKLELNIPGRRKTIYPVFTASTEMKVTFNNVSYTIPANKSIQLLDVGLKEGDNILIIEGNGTITIDYRGGSL